MLQVILDLMSPNVIRVIRSKRMRWVGRVARVAYSRGAYRVLVVRPAGKRHKRRREDKIKMDIQEVEWVGTDWIAVAQDRSRWRALCGEFLSNSGSVSFSGTTLLHGVR